MVPALIALLAGSICNGVEIKADEPATEGKVDKRLADMLAAALDYSRVGKWGKATHLLQGVLDRKDGLVPVKIKGKDGKEMDDLGSAHAEADRLIANLPSQGIEYYQAQYGPAAAELLKKAKDDRKLLEEVVRRYGNTDAGREAKKRLKE
jgi:hypothetical protein